MGAAFHAAAFTTDGGNVSTTTKSRFAERVIATGNPAMKRFQRATDKLVDTSNPTSVSSTMRARRWTRFLEAFPDVASMRVLDLGGEAQFWRHRDVHPEHVVMVNLFEQEIEEPWMSAVAGDGCDLPAGLPEVDLVFSNSVIEHVGGHWRRERFAEQVRSTASRYWVQTPNRYFPIEPHFVFPLFQHLPRRVQAELAVLWPMGNAGWFKDRGRAMETVLEFDLLSRSEMSYYFEDAEIIPEKLAGFTKSWIAVKR